MLIQDLMTPAAILDRSIMQHNIDIIQSRMNQLGVKFRPHVKTSKCLEVVQAQVMAGAEGITVSTLKEAEEFFSAGYRDILYAVGMVPTKLKSALGLIRRGCDLKILTDSVASAETISTFGREHGVTFQVLIEIDTDDHRSGIKPDSPLLLDVARALKSPGAVLSGVMTHAGGSYDLNERSALVDFAEQERSRCVAAADRLRQSGYPCSIVSIGSTPTGMSAQSLEGVTEFRAGVYVFFDLVMHNIGVCDMKDIALSVLTTVIGHQEEKGWAIVDAGWMAMSRDRGTQRQQTDFGYGQVCDLNGTPLPGYHMTSANQEHGIISCVGSPDHAIAKTFPVGTMLRILPNHACATGSQYSTYHALSSDGQTTEWRRFNGW